MIARNGDIDDTSGRNVIREKDRGELDLYLIFISIASKYVIHWWSLFVNPDMVNIGGLGGLCFPCDQGGVGGQLTRRLSWVRRTATPASTLPTVKETSMVDENWI